ATGSVAGAMGAYWASLSNEVDISMVIEQGYAMQRPSLIHVEVSNREIQKIRVGGQCQSVFTGLMDLEGKS
ncbi:MAG: PhzF family phenazine biosynthesis protein, partial [Nitrospinaceae bacterium]